MCQGAVTPYEESEREPFNDECETINEECEIIKEKCEIIKEKCESIKEKCESTNRLRYVVKTSHSDSAQRYSYQLLYESPTRPHKNIQQLLEWP